MQEVRGRGLIQGLQLTIPARPIVEQALAEGVLFNSTQDRASFSSSVPASGETRRQRHSRTQEVARGNEVDAMRSSFVGQNTAI